MAADANASHVLEPRSGGNGGSDADPKCSAPGAQLFLGLSDPAAGYRGSGVLAASVPASVSARRLEELFFGSGAGTRSTAAASMASTTGGDAAVVPAPTAKLVEGAAAAAAAGAGLDEGRGLLRRRNVTPLNSCPSPASLSWSTRASERSDDCGLFEELIPAGFSALSTGWERGKLDRPLSLPGKSAVLTADVTPVSKFPSSAPAPSKSAFASDQGEQGPPCHPTTGVVSVGGQGRLDGNSDLLGRHSTSGDPATRARNCAAGDGRDKVLLQGSSVGSDRSAAETRVSVRRRGDEIGSDSAGSDPVKKSPSSKV